ncbi:MAG TPA: ABC transporter permease [Acidimicrobiales bacterium]|nr:ABC transporter permease [Acidimicrobiales bacterium]
MTATTIPLRAPTTTVSRSKAAWAVADALSVAKRNIISMMRMPQVIVLSTVQPIIFVLMFRYVFGASISVPGVRYVDYLMAGIFVQTVTFGAMNTGVGLAEDLQKGLIERFRSLAMARSAVLAGRTLADLVRNLFVVVLMVIMGFIVGFHLHTNALGLLGAVVVLLVFGLAMSWVMALVGLVTRNAEAAQAAAFPLMALLVFPSNAFVATRSMPKLLRAYANHQPVSATVNAVRALVLGGPTLGKVVVAFVWAAGIVAVFAPLAVRRYRQAA